MKSFLPIPFFASMLLIGLSLGIIEQANGQCNNTTSFGTVSVNTSGTVVTITTCAYAGEYSTINGAVAGQTLQFTSSIATDYITIRSGTPGGPVLAFGQTPVTFSNTFTGTIYAHWNTNAACGTQSSCRAVTVQCTSCTPSPAPANDLCANAIPIACGTTASGTTVNATVDNVTGGSCGVTITAPGVWYTFTSPGTGNATVSLCGSSYDTKISVFSGTCGSLVCIGGNDDFCGLQSQLTFSATNGTTYYVLVYGFSSNTGAFNLALTCPAPASTAPANDLCANAAAISCGQTLSGTTVGATFDGVATCTVSNTSPGVWYAFTGTGAPATVSTCGQASFDTKLSVFTGSCGALVCVGGNDDFTGCSGFTSQFTFPTTAGTTYYVLVHGFSTATGTFSLSLTCAPVVLGCTDPTATNYNPNANTDDGSCVYPPTTCAQAIAVGVGTHNTGPINSGNGASNLCTFPISGNATHARWYTFTPALTGQYTIGSAGFTSVDTRLSIHTGTCGNLTCYARNDDVDGGSFASRVTDCFNAGTTYYIEWDNHWSSSSFN